MTAFLSYFTSPLARAAAILAVVAAIFGAGYGVRGKLDAARQAQAEKASMQRDVTQGEKASKTDDALVANDNSEAKIDQERSRAYQEYIAKNPDAGCALNADDLRRL